jgi:hypothetical protein
VVANSKEQAEIIDRYSGAVAMHPSVERRFEPRFRDCVALTVDVADEVCARPAPIRDRSHSCGVRRENVAR